MLYIPCDVAFSLLKVSFVSIWFNPDSGQSASVSVEIYEFPQFSSRQVLSKTSPLSEARLHRAREGPELMGAFETGLPAKFIKFKEYLDAKLPGSELGGFNLPWHTQTGAGL